MLWKLLTEKSSSTPPQKKSKKGTTKKKNDERFKKFKRTTPNQGLKYQSDKNFANSPLPLKATIMIKCEIQSYHPQCNVAHVSIGSMAESVHTYIVFSN